MFLAMGFGKTPENRAPMYLTVIEGLIGWLMLTIFTITLLSQLLQAW
jgi:multidrug efflux pump subunit AcrB